MYYSSVYRFDGTKWHVCASLNVPRASPAVCVVNGRILAIGGISSTQAPSDKIELYDNEKWTLMSVLPEALMGISTIQQDAETSVIMGGMAMDTCPRDTVNTWTESNSYLQHA